MVKGLRTEIKVQKIEVWVIIKTMNINNAQTYTGRKFCILQYESRAIQPQVANGLIKNEKK